MLKNYQKKKEVITMKVNFYMKVVCLTLIVVLVITGCRNNLESTKELNIKELIENEEINDLCLTIYYIDTTMLTNFPLNVDQLIGSVFTKRVVVNGSELDTFINLFKNIDYKALISVKEESSYLDARLYYILESKKNGKLIDVVIGGGNPDNSKSSIWINDCEIENCAILYDLILPFLPEDDRNQWEILKNQT